MAAAQRSVRHLRLRAGSEAAVRRMVPVLEDALRCASLADAGGRLLVVRRLALGRLPADITSPALAHLIGQRAAEAASHWVPAGSAGAETAPCVAFAGALQARVQLAQRLVRGQPCDAWYWPRAVPEFDVSASVALALRRMAWAIAGWPEARVALPAWAAEVAREAAGAARLVACMPEEEGEALLRQAGVVALRGSTKPADVPPVHAVARARVSSLPTRSAARERPRVLPDWVEALLLAAGQAVAVAPPGVARAERAQPAPRGHELQRQPQDSEAHEGREVQAHHVARIVTRPANVPAPSAESDGEVQPRKPPPAHRPGRASPAALAAHSAPSRPASPAIPLHGAAGDAFLEPTACGGLLFLLPLLQRLGLPVWLPPDDSTFASLVLRAALRRLSAPADDPAWALLAHEERGRMAYPAAAPDSWCDPSLVPLRGDVPLTLKLARCSTAADQAQAWLDAARYWLRRTGRMGLATLVLRPARLGITATHADVAFDLAHADLRVRRLGLDLDPGWLPWFGRVVGFHYEHGRP